MHFTDPDCLEGLIAKAYELFNSSSRTYWIAVDLIGNAIDWAVLYEAIDLVAFTYNDGVTGYMRTISYNQNIGREEGVDRNFYHFIRWCRHASQHYVSKAVYTRTKTGRWATTDALLMLHLASPETLFIIVKAIFDLMDRYWPGFEGEALFEECVRVAPKAVGLALSLNKATDVFERFDHNRVYRPPPSLPAYTLHMQ